MIIIIFHSFFNVILLITHYRPLRIMPKNIEDIIIRMCTFHFSFIWCVSIKFDTFFDIISDKINCGLIITNRVFISHFWVLNESATHSLLLFYLAQVKFISVIIQKVGFGSVFGCGSVKTFMFGVPIPI